mmetsp:Transcript_107823/g.310567  ORF Transcript_107823/g.310567 Transcript_107823/m.310567 type:complete len:162 (-) Transcript_107823:122-607(-)|eukprot:CAMPEP_0170267770 /NCGR_PEP_ID=MMETSP0116_2-20130129/33812_1 /TAXON_ID=400756 /ORGANISM="Durinskia baltica, Strain CSIRO CS-38" /LENGTH=161 /DNA_ID=CAMNT_0010518927 /DNA_START=68 /DNA_END=553 /DNA_ORIENTATION=-
MGRRVLALHLALFAGSAGAVQVEPSAAKPAPHGFVTSKGSSALRAGAGSGNAACATGQAKHMPKTPKTLAEYKEEATGCLTWCSDLSDTCFAGCMSDCVGYLGEPPCVSFTLDSGDECKTACDELLACHGCLQTVLASNTETCHSMLIAAHVPASGCEINT